MHAAASRTQQTVIASALRVAISWRTLVRNEIASARASQ
jgi:hypothetical protein